MTDPYVLAVASHKGGTGRTTVALSLAWALGQAGAQVTLIDADEQRSASLIALDTCGKFNWSNARFLAGLEALEGELPGDIVVIDPPALTAPTAKTVLTRADGIILTCLADPLSIRTIAAAATVIENAKNSNSRLELLGILICIYNGQDVVQNAMLARLQQAHRDLLLDPVVPFQPEVRNWALDPGSPPPGGPALDAIAELARNFSAVFGHQTTG